MRLIIFIISVSLIIPAFGQKTRKKEDESITPAFTEGIIYSLPRTGIIINLKATCTYFFAGPFAQYAEQLLGIADVKASNSASWSVDDIMAEVFYEPDPENTFKTKGNSASLVSLSSSGCLAGINTDNSVSGTAKLVVNSSPRGKIIQVPASFSNLTSSSWFSQGDSTNNFRVVRIAPEKKAAEAAARIFECRRIRFEIAAGLLDEFHPDGNAYKVSLEELDNIEKENLSLFIGKTQQKQFNFGFNYVPPSKPVKGEVLFRFSEEKGVLQSSDLSGKPVTIDVLPLEFPSEKKGLIASENPEAGSSGVYYRIPVTAEYKILQDLQVISSGRILIPQMGYIAPLPEEYLDGSFSVDIHPETGAIRHIMKKK